MSDEEYEEIEDDEVEEVEEEDEDDIPEEAQLDAEFEEGTIEETEASKSKEEEDELEESVEAKLANDSDDESKPKKMREQSSIGKNTRSERKIIKYLIVPDDERTSSEILSLYEITEAISIRIGLIEAGAEIYLTPSELKGLTTATKIAKMELILRKTPLMVQRAVGVTLEGDILIEEWKVREMGYPISTEQILSIDIKYK